MDDNRKNDAFHGAEADEFWDISKLIPKKPKKNPLFSYPSYVRSHVRTTDAVFTPDTSAANTNEGHLVRQENFDSALALTDLSGSAAQKANPQAPDKKTDKIDEERYAPDFNSLITSVRIVHKPSTVSFYRRFREDAVRLFNAAPPEEAFYTPFYSYVPQYSQLTKKQLDYYLFWREAFRRGDYLECDEAYFRLFVYEVLNLPDLISPSDGLSLLCRALCAYRKKFPRIEKYMTQWLIDYCLLYRLPCPASELVSCMDAIMKNTTFPEFFLYDVENLPDRCVEMLITLVSDYRRRPQKEHEDREQFLTLHMAGAMRAVFFEFFSRQAAVDFGRTSHVAFDVFGGSISAHNIRARLEIDYHPFSLASELGETVRNAAKYAENLLRAHLGIRTRVRGENPPADIAAVIDDYVREHCPKKSAPPPKSEYDALYEPIEVGISWDSIRGIENASWDVTRRLTAEENLSDEPACGAFEKEPEEDRNVNLSFEIEKDGDAENQTLSPTSLAYLSCTIGGDRAGALAVLRLGGISEGAAVEEINEAFLLRFGDVFFENEGDTYRPLLEDYETEVTEWIREMNG